MADVKRPSIDALLSDYKHNGRLVDTSEDTRVVALCKWALELERRAAAMCIHIENPPDKLHKVAWRQKLLTLASALRSLLDQVPKEDPRG